MGLTFGLGLIRFALGSRIVRVCDGGLGLNLGFSWRRGMDCWNLDWDLNGGETM